MTSTPSLVTAPATSISFRNASEKPANGGAWPVMPRCPAARSGPADEGLTVTGPLACFFSAPARRAARASLTCGSYPTPSYSCSARACARSGTCGPRTAGSMRVPGRARLRRPRPDAQGNMQQPASWLKNAAKTEVSGGETGIRTLGAREGTTVFETAPFDRSGTSPRPHK